MNIAQIAQARYTTKAFDPERKIPEAIVEQLCTVLVALGYRGADDFNAKLPKSRLADKVVFTRL